MEKWEDILNKTFKSEKDSHSLMKNLIKAAQVSIASEIPKTQFIVTNAFFIIKKYLELIPASRRNDKNFTFNLAIVLEKIWEYAKEEYNA